MNEEAGGSSLVLAKSAGLSFSASRTAGAVAEQRVGRHNESGLDAFLADLGLEQYVGTLRAKGFELTTDLFGCKDEDLVDAGVKLPGHRRRLLRALESRAFVNVNVALRTGTVLNVQ